MDSQTRDDPLSRYLLRTVRIGVITTVLALACLVIFPILPGHPHIDRISYALLLSASALGAFIVWLVRLFD